MRFPNKYLSITEEEFNNLPEEEVRILNIFDQMVEGLETAHKQRKLAEFKNKQNDKR